MKKLTLASVTALLLTSGVAGAADMAVRYVPPAAAAPCCQGWEGFYFGVYFGSGAGRTSVSSTDRSTSTQTFTNLNALGAVTSFQTFTNVENGASSASGKTTGSVVNLFAGYNWQPSQYWVFGGQLEGTVFSDITGKAIGSRSSSELSTNTFTAGGVTTTTTSTQTSSNTTEFHDELRSMFSFIGRAGFLATPNVLIYALGGGTLGNFVLPDSQDDFGGRRNKWVLGYTVGAGGEVKLNKNWFLRAEYRYLAFKYDRDIASSSNSTSTSATSISTFANTFSESRNTKFDLHTGTIGVAYRFCYCD
jgi:opacity protein-like surface antigen